MQTTSASTAARPVRFARLRAGCWGSVIEPRFPTEAREGGRAGVASRVVELLLDAQQLVVLGDPLGPSGRPGLDLAAVGRDREVGDRGVLGLAGAVAPHA